MSDFVEKFERFGRYLVPRLLTQVCRDPNCRMYGCFDRQWWHYKIRDFPSIILQQGGYALYCASQSVSEKDRDALLRLANSSASFWEWRANKHNAFEEYYPWEKGYPPLAFSTLAMAKLAYNQIISLDKIHCGLRRSANQLKKRLEVQAANQQVAGLAALFYIQALDPSTISSDQLEKLIQKTLGLQSIEGWFCEYGGPDIGYLSVTLDCLWDIYDLSSRSEILESAKSALNFIFNIINVLDGSLGMHQSRNTDYVVPYGISRFLDKQYGCHAEASIILHKLYDDLENPNHFIYAIDDRYWCHYVGHSFFRSIEIIKKFMTLSYETVFPQSIKYEEAGLYVNFDETWRGVIACQKGGIFKLTQKEVSIADYGWLLKSKRSQWVSHWWQPNWDWKKDGDSFIINGSFVKANAMISTPFKHICLRALSFLLGPMLIKFLKANMIFSNTKNKIAFSRTILIDHGYVQVTDIIKGIDETIECVRAPRVNKRHVASADSYHIEDFYLNNGARVEEIRNSYDDMLSIKTIYHFLQ